MRKRGMTLLAAMLVATSASADPARTAGVRPPVPYRPRVDIGLSGGIAYPRCDGCDAEHWGPAIGGYVIARPWPRFGFGAVYERATFEYRVHDAAADASQWLLTPVMRVIPLRAMRLDVWIDGGVGFAGADTRLENDYEVGGSGLAATAGAGLHARAGPRLRIGLYARAIAIGVGRTLECDAMYGSPCGPALPAHVGAYSLGLTLGIVHPGEVEY